MKSLAAVPLSLHLRRMKVTLGRGVQVLMIACLLGASILLPVAHAQQRSEAFEVGAERGEDRAPDQGEHAPDFTLKSIDGRTQVTLSAFRDKQPVVLIFGSWT